MLKAHPVVQRYGEQCFPVGKALSYLTNVTFSKFRVCVFGPNLRSKSVSKGMFVIFRRSNPFQIINVVISLVAILMVHLKTIWAFGNKGTSNQTMNEKSVRFVSLTQGHLFVSFKDVWFEKSFSSCSPKRQGKDVSSIANLVIIKSLNCFPDCFHNHYYNMATR